MSILLENEVVYEIDPEKELFLCDVFDTMPGIAKPETLYSVALWCNGVNQRFSKYKFNSFHNTRWCKEISYPQNSYKDIVSISDFNIIRVKDFTIHALLRSESIKNADSWSHPIVQYLLQHRRRLTRTYSGKSRDYLKMYLRSLDSMLIKGKASHAGEEKCVLRFKPDSSVDGFADSLINFSKSIVQALDLEDSVIASYGHNILTRDLQITSTRIINNYDKLGSDVDIELVFNKDLASLNNICRKFSIDIVY